MQAVKPHINVSAPLWPTARVYPTYFVYLREFTRAPVYHHPLSGISMRESPVED